MAKHFKDNTDNRQFWHIWDYIGMSQKIPIELHATFEREWRTLIVSWIPLRYRGYIITKMKERFSDLSLHPLP